MASLEGENGRLVWTPADFTCRSPVVGELRRTRANDNVRAMDALWNQMMRVMWSASSVRYRLICAASRGASNTDGPAGTPKAGGVDHESALCELLGHVCIGEIACR